jgi:hypothetical protein
MRKTVALTVFMLVVLALFSSPSFANPSPAAPPSGPELSALASPFHIYLPMVGKANPVSVPPTGSTPASSGQYLWSANMETGNMSQWYYPSTGPSGDYGGGEYNSGIASSSASRDVAHTGSWSAKMTITTPSSTDSGVRLFRWREAHNYNDLYFSAWYYFPQRYNVPNWWNVFQWKSKVSNTQVDPFFVLNVGNRGDGSMYFYLYNWQTRQSYDQSLKSLPVGRWFNVEAFYRCAADNSGRVTFWQDGVQLFDVQNAQTRYSNGDCQWSLSNYSDSLNPSPATIYVDDAVISTSRINSNVTGQPTATKVPPTATPVPPGVTPGPVSGTNYYMDSVSGSDSNAGTSPTSPWKTLAKVNGRTFQPGDAINFKRGSFWSGGLNITSSGVQGKPITYRDYGTGTAPIFENNSGQYSQAIRVTGSWVVVQGLLARNAGEAGVRLESGANHNIVQQVEVTNTGIGIQIYGQYNLVTRNYAHDLHMVVNDPGGDNDYGAEGFWIQGPNNEVSYNRCVNCRASSYDYGADGGVVEFFGNADNAYVHHNYGTGSNGFIEVGGGSAQNVRVAYNVSANNYDAFSCVHVGGNFNSTVNNFRIENNTIVKTMSQGWVLLDCMSSGVTASQFLFRNNIVYSTLKVANYGSFTHSNNVYQMLNGASVGYSLGSGEKQANPLLVNVGGGDYHLQAGSPAINAGMNLGYTLDYAGKTVPQGGVPDIGAFEY